MHDTADVLMCNALEAPCAWWEKPTTLKLCNRDMGIFAVHDDSVVLRGEPIAVSLETWENMLVEHSRMTYLPFAKRMCLSNITVLRHRHDDGSADVLWGLTIEVTTSVWPSEAMRLTLPEGLSNELKTNGKFATNCAHTVAPRLVALSSRRSSLASCAFGRNFFIPLHFIAAQGVAQEYQVYTSVAPVAEAHMHVVHDVLPTSVSVNLICSTWPTLRRLDRLDSFGDFAFAISVEVPRGTMPMRHEGHPKRPSPLELDLARSPRLHVSTSAQNFVAAMGAVDDAPDIDDDLSTDDEFEAGKIKRFLPNTGKVVESWSLTPTPPPTARAKFDVTALPCDVSSAIFTNFATLLAKSTCPDDAQTLLTLRLVSRGMRDSVDAACDGYLANVRGLVETAAWSKSLDDITEARQALHAGRLHLRHVGFDAMGMVGSCGIDRTRLAQMPDVDFRRLLHCTTCIHTRHTLMAARLRGVRALALARHGLYKYK